jgi:hypothetical protein
MGGNITRGEIVSREARVETFIIVPRDNQIGLNEFVNTKENLAFFKKKAEEKWPTHVRFNETKNKEAQDIGKTTQRAEKPFYDENKCEYEYDEDGIRTEIPGSCINSWSIGIKSLDKKSLESSTPFPVIAVFEISRNAFSLFLINLEI